MKTLVLILGLVFSMNSFAQSFRKPDPLSSGVDQIAIQANTNALNWIRAFSTSKNASKEEISISNLILSNASKVNLAIEKESSSFCQSKKGDGTMRDAWAIFDVKETVNLYLCKVLLNTFSNNLNAVTQLVVHEYYHFWEELAGFSNSEKDEVYAVDYEINVATSKEKCLPFIDSIRNGMAKKYAYSNYRACN